MEVKGKERETVIESAEMMKLKGGGNDVDGEMKKIHIIIFCGLRVGGTKRDQSHLNRFIGYKMHDQTHKQSQVSQSVLPTTRTSRHISRWSIFVLMT